MADPIVLAKDAAPYTDPGVTGQEKIKNDTQQTVSPDKVAPGTPPGATHSGAEGAPGERAASLHDREAFHDMELGARHTGTNPNDEEAVES